MSTLANLPVSNSFHQLGEAFYSEVVPKGFVNPILVSASPSAARLLGLDIDQLDTPEFLQLASGNLIPEHGKPLAMVYSGHQFGVYVPRLGDGRAIMLGEVKGPDGQWDLQIKGAGKTPYSRFGDGRAVLRSTVREYLCSEAMHGLGIPTTRALAIAGSDEPVQRETVERGAMLIRLARSHVRFGSFEYFHYTGQYSQVKQLADHVIQQHHPDLGGEENPYPEFFRRAVLRTAELIAHWQAVGFAHGVMNTDNMSILGDTIDYGPYGFLDNYDPNFICNHSDETGRYAFQQQPGIALWNCNALAHALSSLIELDALKAALQDYEPRYLQTYFTLMRGKLGLTNGLPDDGQLIDSLLESLKQGEVDYTCFFRAMCAYDEHGLNESVRSLFASPDGFDRWENGYKLRLKQESRSQRERHTAMRRINPKYVLRNYMAETAIRRAEDLNDFSEIDTLIELLSSPFEEHPEMKHYAGQPPEWSQQVCVSCSS